MILAAKYAKIVDEACRSLRLLRSLWAKGNDGNARQVQRTIALVSWRVNI